MKRLPIGIQTLSKIIEDDYLYIDKTEAIHRLVEAGQFFFLSRPRRFGKSLLVSTLKEIFLGNKELFKGLYIYDKIEWQEHPVVHIDFSNITYDKSPRNFESNLSNRLNEIAGQYKTTLKTGSLKEQFSELLKNLSAKGGVVVLVDEYDKPIIDFITNPEKAKANREVLRNFFGVLKSADPYLRMVFITGVSKFSKVSIFSGLNNLKDITLSPDFSTMLGLTDDELRQHFEERLQKLAEKKGISQSELLEQIKYWYNGYSWDGKSRVYNLTSLLNLFFDNKFGNYWFATGTPTFLVSLIKDKKVDISAIEGKKVGEYLFDSFDLDNLEVYSLLFQTGYLTISDVRIKRDTYQYELNFPNREVKESLLNYLLAAYSGKGTAEIQPLYFELLDCLEAKKIDQFITILTSLFAGIPYNLHIKEEKYYHSLCYMILTLMGAKIDLEVPTDKGRMDAVLTLDEVIYVIEFKMGTAEEALGQIKKRRYYEQFLNRGKEVLLLGVGGFNAKQLTCQLEQVKPIK